MFQGTYLLSLVTIGPVTAEILLIWTNEYERQGPAPRAFFGQNRNYLFNFECQPSVQGLAWISPPKKLLKTQIFHPAPRSHQPVPLCVIFLHLSQDHFFSDISSDYNIAAIFTQQCWE